MNLNKITHFANPTQEFAFDVGLFGPRDQVKQAMGKSEATLNVLVLVGRDERRTAIVPPDMVRCGFPANHKKAHVENPHDANSIGRQP